MTQWSHTSTGGSSNSVIPHVNRRKFWLSDPTRPPILATLETFGFASVSAQSYQIVCKNMISRYFSYFKNIRFRRDICSKLSNFIKQHDFSVLLLEGYCIANCLFTFFSNLFISWNIELNWVPRTWNFMDFSVLARYFRPVKWFLIFLFIVNCLDCGRENWWKAQKIHFFDFFGFFSSVWEKTHCWQTF